MIPFEQTDIVVIGTEQDEGDELLALLIIKEAGHSFSFDDFLEDLSTIEDEQDENALEAEIERVMASHRVLEMYDSEDLSEFLEDGELDSDDLHESLYEIYKEESS
jgi:hypothetical protein